MKRALLMTVGTGVGDEEERIHSLAHGLLESIEHYKPDKTIFFGSDISKMTIESLKKQYKERFREDMEECEFCLIHDVDKFDECFENIRREIQNHSDYEVIIDYTSGSKTMTMSAAIASVLYHKKLTFVSGKRGPNGLVIRGTETISPQKLYSYYDEISLTRVKDFFNNYLFDAALNTLNQIVELKNKEGYKNIIQAYKLWDKFDHDGAMELLKSENIKSLEFTGSLEDNKSFLGTLINSKDCKELYLIADLLNNSLRRADEHKYDDATARLYRAVELIAQSKLKEKGIDPSNLDLEKIPIFAKKEFKKYQDKNGKIKIGLRQSYILLKYMDEELGKSFDRNKRLKDMLTKRNESILAHGLTPVSKENFSGLCNQTIELARLYSPKVDDLMEKARFLQLK